MGATAAAARPHIRLLMLVNDVSLRNLIPSELAKGFGFLHGKAPTAFSPVAVTPDELGTAFDGGKVNLPLLSAINAATLKPTQAALWMRVPVPREKRNIFYRGFNRVYDKVERGYSDGPDHRQHPVFGHQRQRAGQAKPQA